MRFVRTKAAPFAAAVALLLTIAACSEEQDTSDVGDDAGQEEQDQTGQTTDETDETDEMDDSDDSEFPVDVSSTGDPYADAKAAAQHVEGSAKVLTEGIVAATGTNGDSNSTAAELRTSLSTLLQEHVYLAGLAVDAAYSFGPESDEFGLAESALDENSVELADLVGEAAGPDNREAFLQLWRQHIGFFVDYAVARAEGDEEARQQALADLDGYSGSAGNFFEDITGGELPADAVRQSLQVHIDTLTAAIDALAADDPAAFDELKGAADHVVDSGATLADGIAAATGADGDVNSEAAQVRSGLATGLQEHVYLAGAAVKTAYAAGPDSQAFQAASETLDRNSVELADGIGQLAGADKRETFLSVWREHIGFFVDYAVAAAQDDRQAQADAIADLNGYTGTAGGFFEEITGGELPADAVAENLREHISTLAGTIDSLDAAING
jgi:hypothetical protein